MPGLAPWLWGTTTAARIARWPLVPAAMAFGAVTRARSAAFERGLLRRRRLPGPTIAVGNLSVGGTGKTPVASWLAGHCLRRHRMPAVLLRGYGGDEGLVHRQLVPGAIVVEDPDRIRGALHAAMQGADVFVLDDAFQRRDVIRDLDLVLVSAESVHAPGWPLPAGPWRESWQALERAGMVAITRKEATPEQARRAAAIVARKCGRLPALMAHLQVNTLSPLRGGEDVRLDTLAGARILVVSGIGNPGSLLAQIAGAGAHVDRMDWADHHWYTHRDIDRIRLRSRNVDHVIVTEKDAVKLRHRWPREDRAPLVARLDVVWECGGGVLVQALDRILDRNNVHHMDARS